MSRKEVVAILPCECLGIYLVPAALLLVFHILRIGISKNISDHLATNRPTHNFLLLYSGLDTLPRAVILLIHKLCDHEQPDRRS